MSKDLNKVMIIGRLGTDPEMRYTPSGSPVTNFRMAASRSWKDANGENREETEWFSIVVWNKLAEICNEYLRKGSRVYIEGRLQTRSWDDNQTGEKKYRTEVVANDMIMLDSREDSMPQQRNSAPSRSRPAAPPSRNTNYSSRGGDDYPEEFNDDDIPF